MEINTRVLSTEMISYTERNRETKGREGKEREDSAML